MRIIAGKFKGRKIDFVSDENTRPTADMVRESLFCKIQFTIAGSSFLDLFSGSGAIGLEALSRGAKKVCFVERDKKNFEIIKKNIKNLYGEDYEKTLQDNGQQAILINSDYLNFLDNAKKYSPLKFVYIDPPYKSGFYKIALQKLKENNLISNESLLILEHEAKQNIKDLQIPDYFEVLSQKKYGIKMLSYVKLKE
jgi:16S rRNA (guanine966-N2)-methyltransferase